MKRFLLAALAVGLLSSGAAQATSYAGTYSISNNNGRSLWTIGKDIYVKSWASTLTISDATGSSSFLKGTLVDENNQRYKVDVTFTGAYKVGSELRWSDLQGTLTSLKTGKTTDLFDMANGATEKSDARLGIDAGLYNGPKTGKLEFGFWAANKDVDGRHNFDMNVEITCKTAAAGNGGCKPGTGVPLPGTLALLGIAALGLGVRAKKRA